MESQKYENVRKKQEKRKKCRPSVLSSSSHCIVLHSCHVRWCQDQRIFQGLFGLPQPKENQKKRERDLRPRWGREAITIAAGASSSSFAEEVIFSWVSKTVVIIVNRLFYTWSKYLKTTHPHTHIDRTRSIIAQSTKYLYHFYYTAIFISPVNHMNEFKSDLNKNQSKMNILSSHALFSATSVE